MNYVAFETFLLYLMHLELEVKMHSQKLAEERWQKKKDIVRD